MTTLITGASSGIGEAIALACAASGDRLFICGRNAERLSAVADACRKLGATVQEQVLDITDEDATRRWLQECDAAAPLDRVFSNAGIGTGIEDEVNVRRTFDVNIGGALNIVLPAIALFRSRGDGGRPRGLPPRSRVRRFLRRG